MDRTGAVALILAAAALCACAADTPPAGQAMAGQTMMLAAPAGAAGDRALEPSDREKLNQGRMIAYTECAACHAVGVSGPSPREDAPPLRSVLARYNTASLEMDLMEGMRVGHADMPRFTFDPRTVDALIVYLESIQDWGLAYRPETGSGR